MLLSVVPTVVQVSFHNKHYISPSDKLLPETSASIRIHQNDYMIINEYVNFQAASQQFNMILLNKSQLGIKNNALYIMNVNT